MFRHYAGNFLAMISNLSRLRTITAMAIESRMDALTFQRDFQDGTGVLSREIPHIPFSQTLRNHVLDLLAWADQRDWLIGGGEYVELLTMVDRLLRDMQSEVASQLFLGLPAPDREMYLEPHRWFGEPTVERFQGIKREVRDACQCFALAQWTATVFHSMRILERGLEALATEVGVPFGQDNWKNVIDQIESKVRSMEALPRSLDKIETIEFYSRACLQFRYFKDAWRNHVMHARKDYDDREAKEAIEHVRDFMASLATKLPQPPASS